MTSYVYQGEEVVPTGRVAHKKHNPKLKRFEPEQMLEIRPIDTTNGDWKKWVKEDELYEITGNIKQE